MTCWWTRSICWASRKPSKRALQLAFYRGTVTISQRAGMLKTYELTTRHFGWPRLPKAAPETRDPGLPARPVAAIAGRGEPGFDLPPRRPAQIGRAQADRGEGAPQGAGARRAGGRRRSCSTGRVPRCSKRLSNRPTDLVHILSPFDPLVIQRKRLQLFFGYDHRFEAYLPRRSGCSATLPCRCWLATRSSPPSTSRRTASTASCWCSNGPGSAATKRAGPSSGSIEDELHRFERFQLAR